MPNPYTYLQNKPAQASVPIIETLSKAICELFERKGHKSDFSIIPLSIYYCIVLLSLVTDKEVNFSIKPDHRFVGAPEQSLETFCLYYPKNVY